MISKSKLSREVHSHSELTVTASRNIAASYVARAVGILTPIVLIPLYTRCLGNSLYGQWVIIVSLTSYLGLTSHCTWQAVANRIAEDVALRRRSEISRLISTAFVSYLVLSGVLAVLVMAFSRTVITRVLSKPDAEAASALTVYAVLALLAWAPRTFGIALRSYERVDIEQRVSIITEAARLIGTAVALLLGLKLLAVAFVHGFAIIVYAAGCWIFAYRLGPETRLRPSHFSGSTFRSLLKPSLGFLALDFAWTINFGIDNLVIGYALGAEAVTNYSVPMRIVMIGATLFGMGVGSLRPTITVHHTQGERERVVYGFLLAIRLALLFAFGGAIALWLIGPAFLRVWAGPAVFPGGTAFGLQILLFVLLVIAYPSQNILFATTRHYEFALLSMAEAALNLCLSLWWVKYYGLAGVIGGTVVARLLTNGWYVPYLAIRTLELPARSFVREIAPAMIIGVGAIGATWAISQMPIDSTHRFAYWTVAAVLLATFAGAFWSLAMKSRDRATIAKLSSILPVIGKIASAAQTMSVSMSRR